MSETISEMLRLFHKIEQKAIEQVRNNPKRRRGENAK